MQWFRRICRFLGAEASKELDDTKLLQFMNHLAMEEKVASSTQKQALNALVFIQERAFGMEVGDISGFAVLKRSAGFPWC